MGRIAQKYGGPSVADAKSIKRVARRIARTRVDGHGVIIIISAMGDATDELMDLALKVSPNPKSRELDMLLTTGEHQSAALLAMALADLGIEAVNYTGSQAGVLTTPIHGNTHIVSITPGRIVCSPGKGSVVIVAGFRGMAQTTKNVTTLGRGASGTTAVTLVSALDTDHCEIYTDVDGVYTADPRIAPNTRRITETGYEEMMELVASSTKIPHLYYVEYTRRESVKVHVRSSFSDKPGTWVKPRDEVRKAGKMEEATITDVAYDRSEAKITITDVPSQVGVAASIFEVISDAGISIDMIVQNVSRLSDARTDVSFTLPMSDDRKGIEVFEANKSKIGFEEVLYDDQIGKISIVDVGIRSHSDMTTTFFETLAAEGVSLQMISTSEIRIFVVVNTGEVDRTVRGAHAALGLGGKEGAVVYAGTGRWEDAEPAGPASGRAPGGMPLLVGHSNHPVQRTTTGTTS